MAAPAPRRTPRGHAQLHASPVERAVLAQRAKRRARIEHERERKRARARFLFLLVVLLLLTAFLALSIWNQIEALFGL